MKIPFVGPSQQARSLNQDAQRSVNCFLEIDQASPQRMSGLYGTPGLRLVETLADAPCRGGIVMGEHAYLVAGSHVYRMTTNFNVVDIGLINTNTGPVGMAQNGAQVIVVDGSSGYIVTVGAVTEIADPDFPAGVTQVTTIDGFFLATGLADSEQIFINETPRNGRRWNGTDFASAEGSPDFTIACTASNRELWLFGADSAEIWVNTGNADFPFERASNAFIECGCGAAWTVATMDNTVYWLGSGSDGTGVVYRAEGYTPRRISTHALERAIASYGDVSDAQAYTYAMEGHSFYVLSFPSADHTWFFDAATQQWYEWLWRDPNLNTLHRHRAAFTLYYNGAWLAGDRETGDVYVIDFDTYKDGPDPIKRIRTAQTMNDEGARLFFDRLQVDMETGVGRITGQGRDPLLMLRYSNDGGHTWSNEKTVSIGAVGKYGARAIFNRLGSGYNRVWEISMTDPVQFAVFGAFVDVTKG